MGSLFSSTESGKNARRQRIENHIQNKVVLYVKEIETKNHPLKHQHVQELIFIDTKDQEYWYDMCENGEDYAYIVHDKVIQTEATYLTNIPVLILTYVKSKE
jgi:hypothetical protein